jgi:acetyl-CoA synthetase
VDFWTLLEEATGDPDPVDTAADDPALLIYTSGTTGPPKGALVAHRAMLGNLPGFELSHNLFPQPDDLFWTPADWAWTGGLWDGLLPTLYHGIPILGYEGGKFDAEKACTLMEKYRVRNSFLPPTAIKMLMQVPDLRARYDIGLRSIMSAGEQVGPELVRWAETELGVTLNEMWGQTEANYLVGNCSAIMPVRPGSMGKPYPGHVVDVIDESGAVMADGEAGELAVRRSDPVMCLGYWKKERALADKFVGDWFGTGDMGYRDADGYLWFLGRKDDVISSAGYRIGPGEIEDALLKHPAIAQAAVIGKPDALRGSIVKAFVVLADGHEPSDGLAGQIQESIRTRLAAYEYPREIEFIAELPLTTTGKVRRMELRQREAAMAAAREQS